MWISTSFLDSTIVEEPDETSSETVTPTNFDSIGDETFEDTSFEIDEIAEYGIKIIFVPKYRCELLKAY
ncbi:hypothetical protein BpHYR1_006505 [Brachionus plicatilis]|uniref:Uncharacterized protein n=1 Tax=Brachionus plicatilis TaxID=10195 RepID=A0A3M7PGM5_BRAPC|nr:hypothetical protein BpHYR1_006505 [Brachionus plicatilis]